MITQSLSVPDKNGADVTVRVMPNGIIRINDLELTSDRALDLGRILVDTCSATNQKAEDRNSLSLPEVTRAIARNSERIMYVEKRFSELEAQATQALERMAGRGVDPVRMVLNDQLAAGGATMTLPSPPGPPGTAAGSGVSTYGAGQNGSRDIPPGPSSSRRGYDGPTEGPSDRAMPSEGPTQRQG